LWSPSFNPLNTLNQDLSGLTIAFGANVWTGATPDGTTVPSVALGSNSPIFGDVGEGQGNWIATNHDEPPTTLFQMYGISQVLVAGASVPEPSTLLMAGMGAIAGCVFGWSRKRSEARRQRVWFTAGSARADSPPNRLNSKED
jgi:PEP-CTERM motif